MNPLSGIFGEAWRIYRAHLGHLVGVGFVIFLVAAVLDLLVSLASGLIVTVLGILITLVAGYLVMAALVKSVQEIREGRGAASIGQTLAETAPVTVPVVAAAALASIGIEIGLGLIIVPGLFLLTIWSLIIPVIVIERAGFLDAFGRSFQLVRSHGLQVFGTIIGTWLILFVVNLIFAYLLFALPLALRNGVATAVAGALTAPFLAVVISLMYYRLAAPPAPGRPGSYPPAA